ncbi:MAG: hypothetical protein V6Z89_25760 [Desulfobacter sp.]
MIIKKIFINLLWALASIIVFSIVLFIVDVVLCFPWLNQVKIDAKLSFWGSIGGSLIGVIGVYAVTSYSFRKTKNLERNREFAKHFVDIEREIKNAKHVLNLTNKLKEFANRIKEESPASYINNEIGHLLYNYQTTQAPLLKELPEKFSFQLRQDFKRYSIAANEHLDGISRSLYSHYIVLRRMEQSGRILVDEYDVDWFKTNFSHLVKPDIAKVISKESGDMLFEFHPLEMPGSYDAIKATCYSNSLLWAPYPLGIKNIDKTIERLENEYEKLKKKHNLNLVSKKIQVPPTTPLI